MKKWISLFLSLALALSVLSLAACNDKPGPQQYSISIGACVHGTVTADKELAKAGETVTVTAIPDEGYRLVSTSVNGVPFDTSFEMPAGAVTVTAVFEAIPTFAVELDVPVGGTLTADKTQAREGETVTVTATPDEGYYLVSFFVNGTASELIFTMPAQNVTLSATFAQATAPTYAVNVLQSAGGTLAVDKLNAEEGETVTVTATPDEGYRLVSTSVNGVPFDTSFEMPAGEVTVTAVFEAIPTFAIELDHSRGGTLTADKTKAQAGETVTLTATPAANCELDCIEVNGVRIDGLTFEMPEGKAVVYATFVADGAFYAISAQNDRHGVVSVSRNEARAGSVVYCDHLPLSGYVLKSYTLDGEEIGAEGRFIMPAHAVTLGAVFVKAIEDTPIKVTSSMLNSDATSHWYITAGTDGIDITVKVEDALLITTGEAHYRDYVALGITPAATATDKFTVGKTLQLVVTADGTCYMRTAVTGTAYGKEVFDFDKELWSGSAVERKLRDKDGYSGYEVTIHISYELLGLTDSAVKTVRLCPALNNSESTVSGNWECYAAPGTEWLIPTTWMTA